MITAVKEDAVGLRRTFASLANQGEPLECIVIDAGTDPATSAAVSALKSQIDHLKQGTDTGIANAFNLGLKLATGDIVAVLNAGDSWLPNTATSVLNAFQNLTHGILFGSVIYERADGSQYSLLPDVNGLARRMTVFHPSMFAHRDVYAEVGNYDERYKLAMDSNWVHRAYAKGVPTQCTETPLAIMHLGGRSDVQYRQALEEYRNSVVETGLCHPLAATAYQHFYVSGKTAKRFARWLVQR